MSRLALVVALASGCAGAVPETHYYDLASPPAAAASPAATTTIAVTRLDAEGPYDDDRIIYRVGAYQLDYYPYQRWAAPPGTLIGDYLADAFARSGRFRAVLRDPGTAAAIALGGRLLALEEVDQPGGRSVARIALELEASDPASGRVVWTARYEEREPMAVASPAGLAGAVSIAMARIAQRATGTVEQVAVEAQHAARVGTR